MKKMVSCISALMLICIVVIVNATSCGKNTSIISPTIVESFEYDAIDASSFTVDSEGNVYAINSTGSIYGYDSNGNIVKQLSAELSTTIDIAFSDNKLYVYGCDKKGDQYIIEIDLSNQKRQAYPVEIGSSWIVSMEVVKRKAYLLCIPDEFENEGNINNSNKYLMEYDLKNNEYKNIDIENVQAVSKVKNKILLYINKDHKRECAVYDTEKEAVGRSLPNSDMGEIISFVVNDELTELYYYDIQNRALMLKRLTDGKCFLLSKDQLILSADMLIYHDKKIYSFTYSTSGQDKENTYKIACYTIGNKDRSSLKNNNTNNNKNYDGVVLKVLGAYESLRTLDESAVRSKTGIGTLKVPITEKYSKNDQLITAILADKEDSDIYLMHSGLDLMWKIRDKAGYEPIKPSTGITEYINSCFDYINQLCYAKDTEIWALPIHNQANVILYNEKNMEKAGYSPVMFKSHVVFMDNIKKIAKDPAVCNNYEVWPFPYNSNRLKRWLDFYMYSEDGRINCNTEMFRDYLYFEKRYTGDERFDLFPFRNASGREHLNPDSLVYNDELMLFRHELDFQFKDLSDEVRVVPEPYWDEKDQNVNYTLLTFMIINRNCKNKDAAMTYVDAVAKTILEKPVPPFLFKNKEVYTGRNINLTVFEDLYNIYAHGKCHIPLFDTDALYSTIWDYFEGKISMDEAIARIERDLEMGLNE